MELPALGAVFNRVTSWTAVSATIYCMSLSLKKLVLGAALLVMPLQGIAATLTVLLCQGDAKAHVMHSPGSAAHGAHQGGQQDESGTGSPVANHPCCNHIDSASSVVNSPAALPDFQIRAFAPDPWYDLFVPEQLQRPPLA